MADHDDDDWEDYAQDAYLAALYEAHRAEAIGEFQADRLGAYYRTNPDVARPSSDALAEARSLLVNHPRAAHVIASTSAEVALKAVLLRPVVHGLVYFEAAAPLIAELTVTNTGINRFRGLLIEILAEHCAVDLREYRREGSARTLLVEVEDVQGWRNRVMHRAENAGAEQATATAGR